MEDFGEQPLLEAVDVVIAAATFLVVLAGLLVAWWQIGALWRQQAFNIIMTAEKDFVELHQKILDDPMLRDLYREVSASVFSGYDDDTVRRFVFLELYYGHLARIHFVLFSKMRVGLSVRERDAYWVLYRNFLKTLVCHRLFQDVHAAARQYDTFNRPFIEEVDGVMQEVGIPARAPRVD